jgi:hypothetical protein
MSTVELRIVFQIQEKLIAEFALIQCFFSANTCSAVNAVMGLVVEYSLINKVTSPTRGVILDTFNGNNSNKGSAAMATKTLKANMAIAHKTIHMIILDFVLLVFANTCQAAQGSLVYTCKHKPKVRIDKIWNSSSQYRYYIKYLPIRFRTPRHQ